jgi:hypothetical protein
VRLAISFHDEPNRDYVLTMNVLLAAAAGVACAEYTSLAWWSIALAAGALAVLELALRSPKTAWLSIGIGTLASAGIGAVGGLAIAAGATPSRAVWWAAGVGGAVLGAALMIDAHRKLASARRRAGAAPPSARR